MIADALILTVYTFVLGINSLLASFGSVGENNDISNAIISIKSYYMALNEIAPIDVILGIVAFSLAFEGFVFIYKLIKWGYQKIPGIS